MSSNPLEKCTGYMLRRASAAVMADLAQALAPLNLRASEASIILYVSENPGSMMSEVGEALGIKRTNLGPIIKLLQARGLISRKRIDGRSQALYVSEGQSELPEQIRATIEDHETRCFTGLSPSEQRKLRNLFDAVEARARTGG